MNFIHSTLDILRDRYAPVSHKSSFRSTGEITPEEFLLAGDFLVYKFPSWQWADASSPAKRVSYLPPEKQFLITRGVPCRRRLNADFAGSAGTEETVVKGQDGEEDWLRTGGESEKEQRAQEKDVRTLSQSGNLAEKDEGEDEEIPDMEDEEDDEEAIIRDNQENSSASSLRTYTLYITYTPYYRTPRFYLSGYLSDGSPLPPKDMMEDIVGDYKDKTVTLEDFPFFENSVKMASVHPCRHASVMKTLLDRADAALKLRREKLAKAGQNPDKARASIEGLVDETKGLALNEVPGYKAGVSAAGGNGGDEWEVLQHEGSEDAGEDDSAIRIDQYLVVFMKFLATMTPSIEHDYTMGV